uniref:Peroxisomal membrane protein MPV17 n=1 Tax=Entomoneis paludosa TaxID=265537 RepID=A0A7S3DNR3_9STRA|mmetsp:Transcript_24009/g.49896  ORF Transcript_24009/g.49896 Transcript_24009/m.49896 type:complete len:277 (+) Transcript_24009:60-890(+)
MYKLQKRTSPIQVLVLGLLVLCSGVAQAFAHSNIKLQRPATFLQSSTGTSLPLTLKRSLTIRGGEQTEDETETTESALTPTKSALSMSSIFACIGKSYGSALASRPIITKSVTASVIFGISDYLAQKFEAKFDDKPLKLNWTRAMTSMAVGLLYFGPAAHAWYDMIFKVFPGTGLLSTLQKAAMGQMFFGPSFTCIFFATSLWQSGQFTLGNWFQKIRQDLPGAWLAGVGFWPLVDLVSYSFVPVQYIPLFVNMCSLVWTIYLSVIANRGSAPKPE